MTFLNKVVWITGASSGIGEALARAFYQRGAKVILSARREEELNRVQASLGAKPEKMLVLPLDLADHDSLAKMTETALAKFGRIDILVNNGGISQRALTKDTKLDVDKKIMAVNYFGTVALTKAVLPIMLKQKSGQIVAISSLAGKFGTPLRSAYAASKHALHGFFESLRAETWHDGIKVMIVCPGYIHTNISVNALKGDGAVFNKMDQAVANGQSPEVCAQKILQGIEQGKNEIFIAGSDIKLIYIKRFFPNRFSRMMRKAAPR
jgi:short-subunit dehydrogenase